MAVNEGHKPVMVFEDWYERFEIDERSNCLRHFVVSKTGADLWRRYESYKREMDARVANYWKLEAIADNEVVSTKPDLPNISSGETAGILRRMARNLVQNAPNVEVISRFDDDSLEGRFSAHILKSNIIGSDRYSNDMQQNLFASTKTSLTLGFATVIPVLLQDAANGWHIKYDAIHYRDVFPEAGCKDVRSAPEVFIRRYLTKGEVYELLDNNTVGWDPVALRTLLKSSPRPREAQSVDHQTKKHRQIPEGYEIITWYSSTGQPFLTFSAQDKTLLRIEKNKHPLKKHPVFFLVLEQDDQQPLGKPQAELLYGRQEFQDLMLNGAMKLWYRNINPSIVGYGAGNAIPNLGPGKYTQVSNPNARLEAFEVNTQTLMQYGTISQQNHGSMIGMVGAADQQMAQSQGVNGQGMSATPQGVDAQQAMVDITTNNYQKAIESFFSHYCSYALTIYFHELQAVRSVKPTAEARRALIKAGLEDTSFKDDGSLDVDFSKLATEYFVRCVPGSLVELEDEKQLRILNELFVPLSQAMPALAAVQDQQMLQQATRTMTYIIAKQIELSGATSAKDLGLLWTGDDEDAKAVRARDERLAGFEEQLAGLSLDREEEAAAQAAAIAQLQENQSLLLENMGVLMDKLGVTGGANEASAGDPNSAAALAPTDA